MQGATISNEHVNVKGIQMKWWAQCVFIHLPRASTLEVLLHCSGDSKGETGCIFLVLRLERPSTEERMEPSLK
jgi:hypothetical protein